MKEHLLKGQLPAGVDEMIAPMTTQLADNITGGLSDTEKMPGYSFGITADACITGGKLRCVEGSVCSVCYGRKKRYAMPTVSDATTRRLEKLGHPRWVEAMAFLINQPLASGKRFFRWHDTGDIQSLRHLDNIVRVCRLTPRVTHWLPTHELIMLDVWLMKDTLPENLIVRRSLEMLDELPPAANPRNDDGKLYSTVHLEDIESRKGEALKAWQAVFHCPYVQYGNKCGPCRACWSRDVRTVSYHVH